MRRQLLDNALVLIADDVGGKPHLITADSLQDLVNDWRGARLYVPDDRASVYFVWYMNRVLNYGNASSFEFVIGNLAGRFATDLKPEDAL